jgi:phage major head subunit gpT-like protein
VETYGRIMGITRQALVNDDLGGFTAMARKFGQSAGEFESSQITGLLTANGTMNDGGALFNATAVTTAGGHANLATGTGSALSVTSLTAGVKAMRLQKGLDTVTPINVTPKFLIVPAALEYTALQLVSMITPASASDVNPYAGKLEVIVDARLDGASTTAWYLAADPAVIDGLEYAYLEDAPGVQLFTEEGWDRDGIEWKARLDFGCGAVEFKGLYKGAGV